MDEIEQTVDFKGVTLDPFGGQWITVKLNSQPLIEARRALGRIVLTKQNGLGEFELAQKQ